MRARCAVPRMWPAIAAGVLAAVGGCDRAPDQFARESGVCSQPEAGQERWTNSPQPRVRQRLDDIERAVSSYFGTPPNPLVPAVDGLDLRTLFELANLQWAAGAPGRSLTAVQRAGLYRDFCVRCHGTSGDG